MSKGGVRRFAARASVGAAVIGGVGAGVVGALHPAAAAATFAAIASAVSCSTSTACVVGNNSTSGPGVTGSSRSGPGVTGTGTPGVTGTGSSGVRGYATTGYGTKGSSNSGYGAQGVSTSSYGVGGSSTNNIGVYGTSTNGLAGVEGSSPNYGVFGTTPAGNGYGIVGSVSGSGTGVYGGTSTGYALYGFASTGTGLYITSGEAGASVSSGGSGTALYANASRGNGFGVVANSNGGVASYGKNTNGNGGDFQGTYIGAVMRAPATNGYPIVATDQNSNNLFYVDGVGNVSYRGGLFAFARTASGATVKTFGPRATQPTVEETGSAQLIGGAATVRLDPAFAASIDMAPGYRVFITPDGDTPHGLFVATKTAAGFVVREAQNGRSTVSFDYRIVATALGQTGQRISVVNPAAAPQAPRPNVPLTAPKPLPAIVAPAPSIVTTP